jgi:hypothetical protein
MASEGSEPGNIFPLAWMSLKWITRFGARVMYREHFGRVIVHVKRALRKDRRLTAEEFNQLLQLSEAIIEYGRMIQAYRGYSVPNVILEIRIGKPLQGDATDH